MFKRDLEYELDEWFNSKRTPLIVKGLIGVGKTTSILHFCKTHYKHVVYIDFRKNEAYKEIFNGDFDIDQLTSLITLRVKNAVFEPKETIIFLDEIQECANARAALKYFKLDGRYDVIASASLLGIKNYNLNISRSVPVGYETYLTMYPLTFKEFLVAINNAPYVDYVYQKLKDKKEMDQPIHKELIRLFNLYLVIGGMPGAINEFIASNNFTNVFRYQNDLLASYQDDFGRNINVNNQVNRDERLFEKISKTFKSIPLQLGKENNKFKYSEIEHGARANKFFNAIEWLIGAGMIFDCLNLKRIESPLSFYQLDDQFKLYFADTGLLFPFFGEASRTFINGESGIYKGAIFENAIACSLIRKGIKPYYFSITGRLEVDFVIEKNNVPIVIETKATNSKAKSLKTISNNKTKYGSENLICLKFYDGNIAFDKANNILNLPYYLIDFINFENIINFLKNKNS